MPPEWARYDSFEYSELEWLMRAYPCDMCPAEGVMWFRPFNTGALLWWVCLECLRGVVARQGRQAWRFGGGRAGPDRPLG